MKGKIKQHKPYIFTTRKKRLEIPVNEAHTNTCKYTKKSNLLNKFERFINISRCLDKVYTGRLDYVCHPN